MSEPEFRLPKELRWEAFVSKVFWLILLGICGFATREIRTLSGNISALNTKMAVVVTTITRSDGILNDHESRIRANELKLQGHEIRIDNLEKP